MRTERDRELGERKEGFVVLLGEKKERWLPKKRKRDGLSGHRNLKTPTLTIYLLTLSLFCVLIDVHFFVFSC